MKKLVIINLVLFVVLLAALPKYTFNPSYSDGTIYQSYAFFSIFQAAVMVLIFVIWVVVTTIKLIRNRLSYDNDRKPVIKMFVSTLLPITVIVLTIDNLYFIYWALTHSVYS